MRYLVRPRIQLPPISFRYDAVLDYRLIRDKEALDLGLRSRASWSAKSECGSSQVVTSCGAFHDTSMSSGSNRREVPCSILLMTTFSSDRTTVRRSTTVN